MTKKLKIEDIKVGDFLNLEIRGLGKGVCEIIEEDGDLFIWIPTEGSYPLRDALKNDTFILTKQP